MYKDSRQNGIPTKLVLLFWVPPSFKNTIDQHCIRNEETFYDDENKFFVVYDGSEKLINFVIMNVRKITLKKKFIIATYEVFSLCLISTNLLKTSDLLPSS